jgi:ankyrin repeat protein
LPEAISKKQYSEDNKHLPKVFYQSEYTDLLFDAVKSNDVAGIKSLLQKGANINAQDTSKGNTLMIHAIKFNSLKALRSLIMNKADIQKTNLQGQTALHIAVISNNPQAVEILLTAGVNPTVKDKSGNRASEYMKPSMRKTAIIMASNYKDKSKALVDFVGLGAYDAVKYALDNGANINTMDDVGKDGDTPLIIAIRSHDAKLVSLLLNKSAKLDVKNKRGKTPIQIAQDINSSEIIDILMTVQVKRELERSLKL